jgi:hypothetical protein
MSKKKILKIKIYIILIYFLTKEYFKKTAIDTLKHPNQKKLNIIY